MLASNALLFFKPKVLSSSALAFLAALAFSAALSCGFLGGISAQLRRGKAAATELHELARDVATNCWTGGYGRTRLMEGSYDETEGK